MPHARRRCAPPACSALRVREACLQLPRAGCTPHCPACCAPHCTHGAVLLVQLSLHAWCGPQELDVTKKTALCTSSVAYQGGRKPQFQINYDLVVRAAPKLLCSALPAVHTCRA